MHLIVSGSQINLRAFWPTCDFFVHKLKSSPSKRPISICPPGCMEVDMHEFVSGRLCFTRNENDNYFLSDPIS